MLLTRNEVKMKEIDILPGDKVELKFLCRVKEVKLDDNDGYFLTLFSEDGPYPHATIDVDMNKAGHCVRKLKFDQFLGDYT